MAETQVSKEEVGLPSLVEGPGEPEKQSFEGEALDKFRGQYLSHQGLQGLVDSQGCEWQEQLLWT